ncbi:hypothetical protein ACFUYE_15050 [Micromonospora humida]|uniref:hypothetical protein n=1 Tax=Micromonospora humida TaxID=2809018 RepID=UPI00366B981D
MSPCTINGAEDVGPYTAGRTELFEQIDAMRLTLAMDLLAEKLPPEQVRKHRREVIHTARFATWWDHWKATYRGRVVNALAAVVGPAAR